MLVKHYGDDGKQYFERHVHVKYRKPDSENQIYVEELENLKSLGIAIGEGHAFKEMPDLTGIEKLINLEEFTIDGTLSNPREFDLEKINRITKNLKYLRIENFNLKNNYIISNFTELEGLGLSFNKISDINFVRDLHGLKELNLQNNDITDVTPISELTNLTSLYLGRNRNLRDISPIGNISGLREVGINHTMVENISGLKNINALEFLYTPNTRIKDFSSIAGKNGSFSNQTIEEQGGDTNVVDLLLIDEKGNKVDISHPRLEKISEDGKYKIKGIENLEPIKFTVGNKDGTIPNLWNVTITPNKPKIAISYKKDGELIKTEEKEYEPNAENGITVGTKFEEAGKNYTISNIDNIPARITENGTYDVEVTEEVVREVVEINDQVLKRAIIDRLRTFNSKPQEENEIYSDELDEVTSIEIKGGEQDRGKTVDLTEIVKLKNLDNLNIQAYTPTNIEKLKELRKLTTLEISSDNNSPFDTKYYEYIRSEDMFVKKENIYTYNLQNIVDVASNIPTLTRLTLTGLEIENVKPLEKLNNLSALGLAFNNISDANQLINILPKVSNNIDLSGNHISDITPIRNIDAGTANGITFSKINLDMNNIKDLREYKGTASSQQINVEAINGIFELELYDQENNKYEPNHPNIEKTNNPEKPNEYRINTNDKIRLFIKDRIVEDDDTDYLLASWTVNIVNKQTKTNVTINYKNKAGEVIKTETVEATIDEPLNMADNFKHNEKNYVVKDRSGVPARITNAGGTFDVTVAEVITAGIIENIVPVVPVKVEKIELKAGETLTIDSIREKITGLDPNATLEEVDGSITNFDSNTPGEKTIKVKIVNENGSSRIIEVPVKVSMKLTPIMPVDTEETKLGKVVEEKILKGGKIDLTDNILELPKNVKVEDITEEKIDTNKPGRYVGKVKVTYPNGVIRRVEIPVEITLEKVENIDVKGKLKIEGEVGKGFEVIVRLYENGKPTDKTVRVTEETGEYVFSNLPKTDIYEKEKVYGVEIENENILVANGYKVELEKNGDIKVVGKKKEDKLSKRILPKAGEETRSVVLTMLAFAVAPIIYFGRKMFKK